MFLGISRYPELIKGIQKIKTSNKTIKEIAGGPLRASTPSCACKPVPEVETDVANSGAQSLLAGDAVNGELAFFYQVNKSGPGPISNYEVVFF